MVARHDTYIYLQKIIVIPAKILISYYPFDPSKTMKGKTIIIRNQLHAPTEQLLTHFFLCIFGLFLIHCIEVYVYGARTRVMNDLKSGHLFDFYCLLVFFTFFLQISLSFFLFSFPILLTLFIIFYIFFFGVIGPDTHKFILWMNEKNNMGFN